MRTVVSLLGAAVVAVLVFAPLPAFAGRAPSGERVAGQARGQSRHITFGIGDVFVVAGTNLGCEAQVGTHVIKGKKLVSCFKIAGGKLAPYSFVAAIGVNGRVVVGRVNANSDIAAAVFDRTPAAADSGSKQITVRAGDQLLLSGTDLACSISNDASGVYPTCFRVTPTGGVPGSYAFAETSKFVAVVQFDSTGKKTKLIFKRTYGS